MVASVCASPLKASSPHHPFFRQKPRSAPRRVIQYQTLARYFLTTGQADSRPLFTKAPLFGVFRKHGGQTVSCRNPFFFLRLYSYTLLWLAPPFIEMQGTHSLPKDPFLPSLLPALSRPPRLPPCLSPSSIIFSSTKVGLGRRIPLHSRPPPSFGW